MRRPKRATVPYGLIEKRDRHTLLPREVTLPPPFDDADRGAMVAVRDGTANSTQQQRVIGWLMFACGENDLIYRSDAPDDVAFAAGRQSISLAIRLMLQTPPRAERG